MNQQQIRMAKREDVELIHHFMGQVGLNTDGLEQIVDNFMLMEGAGGKVDAIVGIEQVDGDGMLRSLVFSKEVTQAQIVVFFQGVIESAKAKGLDKLYLLTPTKSTVRFFEVFGFKMIESIPGHIKESNHYQQTVRKKDNPVTMVCTV